MNRPQPMPRYREVLHDIALGRYGLVTTKDALDEGIPTVELRKLASRGHLLHVGRGLYRDPLVPASELDQFALAVRLVGDGAYVAGESVLAMHHLALVNPPRITVATPHRIWRTLPPLVHAVQRSLPPQALTTHEGIPASTITQAIIDCFETVMPNRLREAINDAGRRQLLTDKEQSALRMRLARRRNAVVHHG